MSEKKILVGIGLKMALYLCALAIITLLTLWLFLTVTQRVMFNHEMTDLSDETKLRGAQLEDLTQVSSKDFQSLARKIEEREDESAETMCRELENSYLLIEVFEYHRQPEVENAGTLERLWHFGNADALDSNLSYLDFRQSLLSRLREQPDSEHITAGLRKARVKINSSDKPEEQHVFWMGGQIVSPGPDGEGGRVLIMGLGFDATLARLACTPRHMAIVLDQDGHVILNPFSHKKVANAEGHFTVPIEECSDPFLQEGLFPNLGKHASEADWDSFGVNDFSLGIPLEGSQHIEELDLPLKPEYQYYFWESKQAGLDPLQTDTVLSALRSDAVQLGQEEWLDTGDETLKRVGGLSHNVSALRLLISAPDKESAHQQMAGFRDHLIHSLETVIEESPELQKQQQQDALHKLHAILQEHPSPISCRTCRFTGITVPLSAGSDIDQTGLVVVRAVFVEEVRAAIIAEISTEFWIMIAFSMILAVFAAGIWVVHRSGKLLERMSASAESISSLTFDPSADVESWEHQSQMVSSRLPTNRQDELGVLAKSFRKMLVDILNAQLELRKLNAELEDRVRRRTEELETANAELTRGRDEARRLARSKDEFLASVSHELRTPLNWLYGAVQFLEMADLQEQQKADVGTVRRATEELRDLIEDILDYQKIIMNGMPIEIGEVALEPLLQNVWESLKMHAQKHGAQLDFQWSENPGQIETDPRRLKQIIKNLAGNACKFRDPNGERPNRVLVNVSRNDEGLEIEVSDTGRGMKPEEQQKLFVKFQKLSAREGNSSGTGLGLVITKSLVELMGGSLTVESEYGVGSTFRVQLPVAYDSHEISEIDARTSGTLKSVVAQELLSQEPISKDLIPPSHTNATVLVIDDDPNMQEMMSRYLSDHGYQVILAATGVEALGLVKKTSPDLITLDVKMPELDGWAVLAALKTDAETAEIPVIMTTTMDDREKGLALGADEYLVKPIAWPHLERVLGQFCSNPHEESILIIEDDEETRQQFSRQLESSGWDVLQAENGQAALDQLQHDRPSMILLDLMMPVMDGFEFLVERQKRPELLSIPVIVVTAKELNPQEREQLRGTVARVMQKGAYSQDDLRHAIRALLERQQRPKGSALPQEETG